MFRPMRRIKQQLSLEESINILRREKRGFIAVYGDMEYPYTFPINYVYADNSIILHSALEGHFTDSIKKHDKVSFAVTDKGTKVENEWYYIIKSVILFGKIRIIEDEKEKMDYLTILGEKYFPSKEYTQEEISKALHRTQVLKIEIEHMTGKIVTEK